MVSVVAKRAGIKRPSAYVVLETLSKRGLVSAAEQRSGRIYTPAPPEQLIKHLENIAKKYSGLADTARKLAPELKVLAKRKKKYEQESVKPNVQFFEGRLGIQSVYEGTLDSLERIRAYASALNTRDVKGGGRARVIFLDTPKAREEVSRAKKQAKGAFLSPHKGYSFSPEINIYDKKIVFISPAEKFAFVVESPELAEMLKRAFDIARKETNQLGKKVALSPKQST
jgi:sugar-specific transcriptional regulator TrmB